MEIWKTSRIEPKYEVSNLGRIRGQKGILNPAPGNHGYKLVYPKTNGRKRGVLIHVLVAHEHVENPNKLPRVNHRDGNKSNNLPTNLEWCTQQYNLIHALDTGLTRTRLPVLAIDGWNGFWFPSEVVASEYLGVSRPCICAALKGRQKTAGGYRWQYASLEARWSEPAKKAQSEVLPPKEDDDDQ